MRTIIVSAVALAGMLMLVVVLQATRDPCHPIVIGAVVQEAGCR